MVESTRNISPISFMSNLCIPSFSYDFILGIKPKIKSNLDPHIREINTLFQFFE